MSSIGTRAVAQEVPERAAEWGTRAGGAGIGVRVRPMGGLDLGRILRLRSVVRWSADPNAFGLLLGMRDARWAVAEASDGTLAGMVGAVPLGRVGILCHLAVHDDYRGLGLGESLSRWAVLYLRSRGAGVVRLYATPRAERLYRSLGFRPGELRTVYRASAVFPNVGMPGRTGRHRAETLRFGDLPELCGLDLWTYGADRSALILAILRLHPGRGLVARDSSGRIKGYLLRSTAGSTTRLGPFAASTPGVARLLLARALEDRAVEVTVPDATRSPAHELLGELGFARRTDRRRMELGAEDPGCPRGLEHYGTTPYLAT
jgi:ribosomal protein S18 acetylase RimI-like enzyme